jgi:hypothetical protein
MFDLTLHGMSTFGGLFAVMMGTRMYMEARKTQNPAGVYVFKGKHLAWRTPRRTRDRPSRPSEEAAETTEAARRSLPWGKGR